jgi:hypothetical protein
MKILVGLKYVPDTEAKVKVAADGASLDPAGVKMIASPYDEFALEEGLKLKEAAGSGEVVVVCAGPEAAGTALREALAKGRTAPVVRDPSSRRPGAGDRPGRLGAPGKPRPHPARRHGVGTDEGRPAPARGLLDPPRAPWSPRRRRRRRAARGGRVIGGDAARRHLRQGG